MPPRFYISGLIGTGQDEDSFRTAVADTITRPDSYHILDGRADPTSSAGFVLTYVYDATPAEHSALLADSRITYMPFEDSTGSPLELDDAISNVDSINLANIKNELEARHIPTDLITLFMTLRQALGVVARRLLLRQILRTNDWTEALGRTISSLPTARRNTINQNLQTRGFDTSRIVGSMTVRQALLVLTAQVGLKQWP